MPAVDQCQLLGMRHCQRDFIKLRHRAVSVVFALNQQQRNGNAAAVGPNIEAAKFGGQPQTIALPESAVYVCMVVSLLASQLARFVSGFGLCNGA